MKKTRVLMLVMSLFVLTPALLGSAWGVENRSKSGSKAECELQEAKRGLEEARKNLGGPVASGIKKTI